MTDEKTNEDHEQLKAVAEAALELLSKSLFRCHAGDWFYMVPKNIWLRLSQELDALEGE